MVLSSDRVRRAYDRIGRLQDTQGFYERPALDALIAHGEFGTAHRVVEVGCGTGSFARRLLDHHLPPDATYLGIELSPEMADITSDRLTPYSARAEVIVADATASWPAAADGADRVVANYLFDLLDTEIAGDLLDNIEAALLPDGLLCTAGLTTVASGAGHVTAMVWTALWRLRPTLTGGCRPISIEDVLDRRGWSTRYREVITAWTVSSEAVVARPARRPPGG